jgi:hypothetical protein
VVNRERSLVVLVLEVQVELGESVTVEHTLVDNGAAREGTNVKIIALEVDTTGSGFASTTDEIETVLEVVTRDGTLDDDLTDTGLGGLRDTAHSIIVQRDITPAHHLEPLGLDGSLKEGLALGLELVVIGKENLTNATGSWGNTSERLGEDLPRDFGHDTDTVAGHVIGRASTTVLHAGDRTAGVLDDLMGFDLFNVGNETNPTCVVLLQHRLHARCGR